MRTSAIIIGLCLAAALAGCVERKLTVISTPPGARVYLDGQEMGITPVTFRFDWYGKREFLLRRDGYRTLREVCDVHEPFYERPFINIVSDLTPLPFTDHKTIEFTMQPVTEVNRETLLDRANEMKYRLEGKPIPARARPTEPPAEAVPAPEPAPETPAEEAPAPEPSPEPPVEPKPDITPENPAP